MQRNEVAEFLVKIDSHLAGKSFKLRIIGKSALLLSGLNDSTGTVDIDSLGVDGENPSSENHKIAENLLAEFGRAKVKINGYYLEFVAPSIVFLPRKPKWTPFGQKFKNLDVELLEPHHVIASKLFSAFSTPQRKKDKQDIIAALDQKLVMFQEVVSIADEIFDLYSMDARSDRFSDVTQYITEELMRNYGKTNLNFVPGD